MLLNPPHIVFVDDLEFTLGTLKKNIIHYDFNKIIKFLHAKGKSDFGQHFKIYKQDLDILFKLCSYMVADDNTCSKLGLNTKKGLLLSGPVGCGKTSLMRLLRYLTPHKRIYKIIPCRNTVFSFNHLGYKTIEDYGNEGFFCFDDLGVEPTGRHYGKDCNVMGEILLSRYDRLCHPERSRRVLTHCTTNLNAQEIEQRYGNRVRSRMRQMFNLVSFHESSRDKRN